MSARRSMRRFFRSALTQRLALHKKSLYQLSRPVITDARYLLLASARAHLHLSGETGVTRHTGTYPPANAVPVTSTDAPHVLGPEPHDKFRPMAKRRSKRWLWYQREPNPQRPAIAGNSPIE